jgi:methyl coenzyme M reductase subunit C-like uncharacterized protein (methanogenesis marker protein 7)
MVQVSLTVVPLADEVVAAVAAEDDTVVTTVMVRKRLEHQVPRANTLRKKVRLEKQRKTTMDQLRVSVADEAFMAEVGMEVEVEVDGPTPTPITDIMDRMDDEDLPLHLADPEAWVPST